MPGQRRAPYCNVGGFRTLAIRVLAQALDEIGPRPSRQEQPAQLKLAVRPGPVRKEALRWLVEDVPEVECWCAIADVVAPRLVYAEARDRLAAVGFYEPRLDALAIHAAEAA